MTIKRVMSFWAPFRNVNLHFNTYWLFISVKISESRKGRSGVLFYGAWFNIKDSESYNNQKKIGGNFTRALMLTTQHHIRPSWLASHWRLLGSLIIGAMIGFAVAIVEAGSLSTSFIIGWDSAVVLYIISIVVMMRNNTLHSHLNQAHEGKAIILALIIVGSLICLLAIVAQTQIGKDYAGTARLLTIILTVGTIFITWFMIQVIFALQYAYLYFAKQRKGALKPFMFPETLLDNYLDSQSHKPADNVSFADFFYGAVAIGTSGQTADIAFTSTAGRTLATLHSIVAFVFNLVIISLLINIIASYL